MRARVKKSEKFVAQLVVESVQNKLLFKCAEGSYAPIIISIVCFGYRSMEYGKREILIFLHKPKAQERPGRARLAHLTNSPTGTGKECNGSQTLQAVH